MSARWKSVAVILSLSGLCACDSPPATTTAPASSNREDATVRFVDVETGCWALDTAAGRVQPIDLPEAFRKDGLAVSVELRDAPDMMSTCQVGALKHVEHIEEKR